jgi:hypothetical protein
LRSLTFAVWILTFRPSQSVMLADSCARQPDGRGRVVQGTLPFPPQCGQSWTTNH